MAILVIATFYPGVEKDKALAVLNSTPYIAQQHINSEVLAEDLSLTPVPFGVLATTYEGLWYITFWGEVN